MGRMGAGRQSFLIGVGFALCFGACSPPAPSPQPRPDQSARESSAESEAKPPAPSPAAPEPAKAEPEQAPPAGKSNAPEPAAAAQAAPAPEPAVASPPAEPAAAAPKPQPAPEPVAVKPPPRAAAHPVDPAPLRLDTWDKTYSPNDTPPNWEVRKFSPGFGSGDVYFYQFVHNGPNEHYLHLRSGKNNSFSVGYGEPVDIVERPWVEWDWKMGKLPKGGDVRVRAKDDQAGSLCLVVNPSLLSLDSLLCYLFENDGPKDQPITSTKRDDSRYLILRTAKSGDPIGEWLHERRNVLADYKRVFGHAPKTPTILGVDIDSNDTESSAEAFYRNLTLHKY